MSKFLINSDFVALRKGDFVSADQGAGEFILDTNDVDLAKGALEEIAGANKIKISKKLNKDSFVAELIAGLEKLKLSEVNKMTQSEQVEGIVKAGHDANKTEDEMMVEIITSGIKFKEAGKLYEQACQKLGLKIAPKERKEQADEILYAAEFNPEEYSEVEKMAAHLSSEISDTSERQATSLIKRWAKENEIELPKKPKASSSEGPSHGLGTGTRGKVFTWMLANTNATQDQLTEFMLDLRGDKADHKTIVASAERFYGYFKFADMIAGQRVAPEQIDPAEDQSEAA